MLSSKCTDDPCDDSSHWLGKKTVESPCQRVCKLDQHRQFCIACGRTVSEIAGWTKFTDDERKKITERLSKR